MRVKGLSEDIRGSKSTAAAVVGYITYCEYNNVLWPKIFYCCIGYARADVHIMYTIRRSVNQEMYPSIFVIIIIHPPPPQYKCLHI